LTGSELRRLFLRLPALRALPQQNRTLVAGRSAAIPA
jgi:hypothetical protein